MTLKSKVAVTAIVTCVVILVYTATYLVWSRKTTWNLSSTSNAKDKVWTFYRYPAGLMAIKTYKRYYTVPGKPWHELWWKRERIPATIFRPLIWLDYRITGRMHYPDQYKGPGINFS